jgi:hypothetical protein
LAFLKWDTKGHSDAQKEGLKFLKITNYEKQSQVLLHFSKRLTLSQCRASDKSQAGPSAQGAGGLSVLTLVLRRRLCTFPLKIFL